MIEAISAMNAVMSELTSLAGAATAPSPAQLTPDVSAAGGTEPPSFMSALRNAVGSVDGLVSDANTAAKAFSAGDKSLTLSDVMVSLEQANLAMQMASQVRDKVVAAYTNIMNMQV